ncbi:hypothetical protein VM1G_10224 [Cytospora mali]|uniref:Uncharacterized protein n=1 Tax=Cytospora mali TaxID=578113 RepID=A0A194VI01_CYTMA|nr:hypothetical protein VM1G_10224 [Valsa mali]
MSQASFVSFSLVNKACYAVQEEASRWTKILQRTGSLQCVCQIAIVPHGSKWKASGDKYTWLDEVYGECHPRDKILYDDPDEPFRPFEEEKDRAWLPVAGLVGLLSHLSDLVFTLDCTYPPCLLRVLHKRHPQCHLHIYNFRFRSLQEPVVGPHELAIATLTSPCLHGISYGEDNKRTTKPYPRPIEKDAVSIHFFCGVSFSPQMVSRGRYITHRSMNMAQAPEKISNADWLPQWSSSNVMSKLYCISRQIRQMERIREI